MQAITTKYLGPTNTKCSRIKVYAQAGTITVVWDYALNTEENHAAAAKAYALKWGWSGRWVGSSLPDGKGSCFVNVGRAHEGGFEIP